LEVVSNPLKFKITGEKAGMYQIYSCLKDKLKYGKLARKGRLLFLDNEFEESGTWCFGTWIFTVFQTTAATTWNSFL